jgi:hypothetical protein
MAREAPQEWDYQAKERSIEAAASEWRNTIQISVKEPYPYKRADALNDASVRGGSHSGHDKC